jgi:hypothetical protein
VTIYGTEYPDVEVPPPDEWEEAPPPLYQAYKCWTGPELQRTDFPPLRWVVPNLVPAGLCLLVGPPKVGKSWAALDIALAVAAGGKALGALDVEAGQVLFLALEDGPARLSDRQNLLLGRSPASDAFHAYTEWPRGVDAARAAWQWCEDHPDVRLVVVDTLARVRPQRARGGSAYDEDTSALIPWQKLAEHFKVAVILVHHDRKAGDGGDFVDAVSGTHGLAGVADTTLVLDRARMEDYGRIRLTGRDVLEREVVVRRVGPTWMLHDGPMPDPDLGDASSQVLTWVRGQDHAVRPSEAALALGLPGDNVKRTMARLAESGRLVKRGRGLYTTPVPSVPSVPFEGGD